MARLGKIEMELKNREKIRRTITRLKYSLMADNELNEKLDEDRKTFFQEVQQSHLPDAIDLTAVEALDKVLDA